MNVHLEYFAQLGQAAGRSTQMIEVEEPCTVQELIVRVAGDHGDTFRSLVLDDTNKLRSSVLLFVGESQVRWDTPRAVQHEDRVLLATPIAGG